MIPQLTDDHARLSTISVPRPECEHAPAGRADSVLGGPRRAPTSSWCSITECRPHADDARWRGRVAACGSVGSFAIDALSYPTRAAACVWSLSSKIPRWCWRWGLSEGADLTRRGWRLSSGRQGSPFRRPPHLFSKDCAGWRGPPLCQFPSYG